MLSPLYSALGPLGRKYGGATQSPFLTGLAHAWYLDETSGTRIDSVGVAALTDNNTVGFVAGKRNNAARIVFADFEYLNKLDGYEPRDKITTVSTWIYLNDTGVDFYGPVLGFRRGLEGHFGIGLGPSGGAGTTHLRFHAYIGSVWQQFGPGWHVNGTPGGWRHVVCTIDDVGKTIQLWLDGVSTSGAQAYTGTLGSNYDPTDKQFQVGYVGYNQTGNTANWVTTPDEMYLWQRAPTAQEVVNLFNSGAGRFHPSFA